MSNCLASRLLRNNTIYAKLKVHLFDLITLQFYISVELLYALLNALQEAVDALLNEWRTFVESASTLLLLAENLTPDLSKSHLNKSLLPLVSFEQITKIFNCLEENRNIHKLRQKDLR